MSDLEIIFMAKVKQDDERVTVSRNGDAFKVSFGGMYQSGSTGKRIVDFHSADLLREYLTNMLYLVTFDNDPCMGVQFCFPASPSVVLTHSTLKKDEVWDCMLDNLDFWLAKPRWPRLPPISPILAPADVTKTEIPDIIDLTDANMTIKYDSENQKRSVYTPLNKHTFFTECGCESTCPRSYPLS